MPAVTVIINTYNRADRVGRAIASVLGQDFADFEVVVVDDGSRDHTPEVVASFEVPRLRAVRQENRGLCAARNRGLAEAKGDWVGFLDDDDLFFPGVLAAVARAASSQVGYVCGAALLREPRLGAAWLEPPVRSRDLFGGRMVQFLPGAFFARRELLEAIGGYREELLSSHQTDLGIRLCEECDRRGLREISLAQPFVQQERASWHERPLMRPAMICDGTLNILRYHAERMEREPRVHARFLNIAGVAAARLGRAEEARRLLGRAWRLQPRSLRYLARWAVAAAPGAGRWLWGGEDGVAPPGMRRLVALQRRLSDPGQRGVPREVEPAPPLDGAAQLANAWDFLPFNYRRNPQASAESEGKPYWERGEASTDDRYQVPVYRLAARLVRPRRIGRLVDFGCGMGEKLVRWLAPTGVEILGVDQERAIRLARERHPDRRWLAGDYRDSEVWRELAAFAPDLVVNADVIEHLDEPRLLLERFHRLLEPKQGMLLLSTPNRARLEGADPNGPPTNPRHVQEWTPEEMRACLLASGFEVLERWDLLPRSYAASLHEAKRLTWRLLHRLPLPDPRRCMVFLARAKQA